MGIPLRILGGKCVCVLAVYRWTATDRGSQVLRSQCCLLDYGLCRQSLLALQLYGPRSVHHRSSRDNHHVVYRHGHRKCRQHLSSMHRADNPAHCHNTVHGNTRRPNAPSTNIYTGLLVRRICRNHVPDLFHAIDAQYARLFSQSLRQ